MFVIVEIQRYVELRRLLGRHRRSQLDLFGALVKQLGLYSVQHIYNTTLLFMLQLFV